MHRPYRLTTALSAALTLPVALVLATTGAAGADVGEGWAPLRPLAGVLAGNGLDQAAARWVDTGLEAEHPQASLRLARSSDDGGTFTDTVDAPVPASGTPGAGVVEDVAVGPQGTVTWVLSTTSGPEPGTSRLRTDWYYRGFAAWGAPRVVPAASCPTSRARPQLSLARDLSVVVVDACLGVHRTADDSDSWHDLGRLDAGTSAVRSLVLTPTPTGFSLLFTAVPATGTTPRLLSTTAGPDAVFAPPTPLGDATVDGVTAALTVSGTTLVAVDDVLVGGTRQTEVRRSSDGGRTWSAPVVVQTSDPAPTGGRAPSTVVAVDAGLDLLTVDGAGSWHRLRSLDDGDTWRALPAPPALAGPLQDVSASGGTRVHLLRDGQYTQSLNAPGAPRVAVVAQTGDAVTLQLTGDSDTTAYAVRWASGTTPPASPSGGDGGWSGTGVRTTLTGLPEGDVSFRVVATSSSPSVDEASSEPTLLTLRRTTSALRGSTGTTAYAAARSYDLSVLSGTGLAVTSPAPQLWGRVRGTSAWTLLRTGARVTLTPTATMELQAVHPGSAGTRPSRSPVLLAPVQARVDTALSSSTVALRRSVVLTATVLPGHAGRPVWLQRYSGGAWRTVASRALSSTSRAAFTLTPTSRGTVPYRVVLPAQTDHALSASAPRALTTR